MTKEKITTGRLFTQAASEVGATVKILNQRPQLLRLEFSDGVAICAHKARVPLNSRTSMMIMGDKDLTVKVLETEGLPTPRSHLIQRGSKQFDDVANPSSKDYHAVTAFLNTVGFPIFLKPNKGSQGRKVFRIDNREALDSSLLQLAGGRNEYFLLQEACFGTEYRIVIVRGEIQLALQRHPLAVTGDGKSTIEHLIKRELKTLREQGRKIGIAATSTKIDDHITRQGFKLSSVLADGQHIAVLANKNLSNGARPIACTTYIRERYADLCSSIYTKLGIEYCGVDLIEDTRNDVARPFIIELNGSPGYTHFIRSGHEHPEMVKSVFHSILRAAHEKQRQAIRSHQFLSIREDRRLAV